MIVASGLIHWSTGVLAVVATTPVLSPVSPVQPRYLAQFKPASSDHFKNTTDFSVSYLSVYWLYFLSLSQTNRNKEPG